MQSSTGDQCSGPITLTFTSPTISGCMTSRSSSQSSEKAASPDRLSSFSFSFRLLHCMHLALKKQCSQDVMVRSVAGLQEGIIPAPEPTHAIAAAIREALLCKETGEEKVLHSLMAVLGLCHDGIVLCMPVNTAVPLQSLFRSMWRCSSTNPTHTQLQFLRRDRGLPHPRVFWLHMGDTNEGLLTDECWLQVILTALCGHGHFDLASYETFLSGRMEDVELEEETLAKSMATIPVIS